MNIPQTIVDAIFLQAEQEAPLEACGYLAGSGDIVAHRYSMTNVDKSAEHFTLDPKEQFAVMKDARAKGLDLIGVYHSHPATPARPSVEDIRLANDPNIVYVIASLAETPRTIKAFRIADGTVTTVPLEIINA